MGSTPSVMMHYQNMNRDAPIADYQVDVRCFAIFIALQLYA